MNSIRARLLAGLGLLLLLAALLLAGVTYRQVLAETEALFDYQLRQMALSLRDQGEIDPHQADALAEEDFDFIVQIWSADGRTIYASRVHSALPGRALLGWADVRAGDEVWRSYGVATPGRVIQVAQPLRVRERLATAAALRSLGPLALLGPLLALAVWALAAWALRPLARLAGDLRMRDAGALAPLPSTGLPEELTPLVGALNGLLGRLGQALDAQRAFVADAAHELRSPLTALKLQLHLLRRSAGAAADDAAAAASRAETVEALAAGIERAARLVEQLLVLARSEPGAPAADAGTLDLAALAREALAQVAATPQAEGARLSFACTPQADPRQGGGLDDDDAADGDEVSDAGPLPVLPLVGEPAALHALLRNLLDNALRYGRRADPAARVALRLGTDAAGAAVLVVDDAGPGIPPEQREAVLQRFVRGAGAQRTSGSGLGLAIVRQVAERHGATLSLGDSPWGGLRVALRFPPPSPPPAAR